MAEILGMVSNPRFGIGREVESKHFSIQNGKGVGSLSASALAVFS